ncbi:MAG TPA: MFS transporter, partial [Candidatus Altiarchaeales archaeon]|nr:MFS transporter [Candidatus Altiarchaeales archaeon]
QVLSGYLSGRTGKRKIFVYSGYLTSAVFKLLLSFSRIWHHVLIFASLERIGKGIRTAPRDSIIADSMPKKRGKGFGIHRAFDESGAILGTVVVFLLLWFMDFDFSRIIFIAAIISFLSIVPLHFVSEEKRKPKKITLIISLRKLSMPLKLFILVAGIFALSNFSYMFFIMKAQESFTDKFAIAIPILLYALFKMSKVIFSISFGILSDRFGRRNVLIFGYLIFSIACLGFAYFNSLIAFIILFSIYGLADAIVDGNQRAFVSDLSPDSLRSTALGTYHTTIGLMALPSSIVAGLLWQVSPEMTFIYGGVASIIASILFIAII